MNLRIRLDYSLRSPVCRHRRRRRLHCRSSWLQQITIHWRQTWEFIATYNGDHREKVAGITKSERNVCTPVTNNIAFFSLFFFRFSHRYCIYFDAQVRARCQWNQILCLIANQLECERNKMRLKSNIYENVIYFVVDALFSPLGRLARNQLSMPEARNEMPSTLNFVVHTHHAYSMKLGIRWNENGKKNVRYLATDDFDCWVVDAEITSMVPVPFPNNI